jgi:hypothetical protein
VKVSSVPLSYAAKLRTLTLQRCKSFDTATRSRELRAADVFTGSVFSNI